MLIILSFFFQQGFSQNKNIDSLRYKLNTSQEDSARISTLRKIANAYEFTNLDSALIYEHQARAIAKNSGNTTEEVKTLNSLGYFSRNLGDIPEGLAYEFEGLQLARANHYLNREADCLVAIGFLYFDLGDYMSAINYYRSADSIFIMLKDNNERTDELTYTGAAYRYNNQLDSALQYLQKSYAISRSLKLPEDPDLLMYLGDIQFQLNNHSAGFNFLQKSIQLSIAANSYRTTSSAYNVLAKFYKEINQLDSCIYYAQKGLEVAQQIGFKQKIVESCQILAQSYEPIDIKKSLYYLKLSDSVNEELYGKQKVKALQKTLSEEQKRQRESELLKIANQNKIKLYGLLAGLGAIMIIAFLFYNNARHKQKANALLKQQKEKVEIAYSELKSTQAQLIQSEKMASLGELTAGIAHEIQNPLNFVNNFSEVNTELLKEMKTEIDKGNFSEARSIADSIIDNEEKINNHGRRADSIVKGMLQHSRTSTGQKEPTDINALADEYLRLAYHGLRAKNSSFNATMKTDFDPSIGKINIVPQDIGRVLLNMFNNAFYAVTPQTPKGGVKYEPCVSVSTRLINPPSGGLEGGLEIRISDNGNGIPQKILDKIFQPFFTTKPTGQGTGLGLSLSYDIIKAHGGEIKVETQEGEGTTFIITLPGI